MRGGHCVVPAKSMWVVRIHGASMLLFHRKVVKRRTLYTAGTKGPATRGNGGSKDLKIASKVTEAASAM